MLIGQTAIDAGMADGFGTFETTLAALAQRDRPAPPYALPSASMSAADREFERVKAAALARIAAEERAAAEALAARQAAQAAEDSAVDGIFAAMAKAEGRSTEAENDSTVRAVLDAKRLHSSL